MALDVPAGTPDQGPAVVAMCIVIMALTIGVTILRIVSKFVVKQNWWWDDFFALISLPNQLALLSILLAWRNIGLGLHAAVVQEINPLHLLQGAKYLYMAIFIFDASICFPKLSAIFFYARIFPSHNRIFTMNLWVVGGLVVGWLVAAIVSTVFQCSPIEKAWNTTLPGTCIDQYAWYLATASLSTAIDFYILVLPVPMIWALKISLNRRIYLLMTFFLAYSVIVISIGRLISTTKIIPTISEDLTWKFTAYLYWACFEGAISLICVSVPNMISLVKNWVGPCWPKTGTSVKSHTGPKPGSYGDGTGYGSQSFHERHKFERLVSTKGANGSDTESQRGLDPIEYDKAAVPLGNIRVRTDIRVSSEEDRYPAGSTMMV